jgi:hypothetical protein
MSHEATKCKTCNHRERAAIDLALARGVSVRALATRYGLTRDSLYRHQRQHLPAQLRAKLLSGAPDLGSVDLGALRETESQSLLAHLVAIRGRLLGSLDIAEEHGDGGMLARIASQLHENLALTGRLVGTLTSGSTNVTNVLVMPQYVELRVSLVNALRPFPEAARAVAGVLHQIEAKAAADITADRRELAA